MSADFFTHPVDRVIDAALKGLSLRQRAIASNLANVDTPGYKALRVRFEDRLKEAIRNRRLDDESAFAGPKVEIDGATTMRNDGNNVDIDEQLVLLNDTVLRYSALVQVMNRRLGMLRAAVTEGRR
jgi:flagellar basal-body rod protein FlgB